MSGDNGPYYDVTLPDGRTVSCNDVIDALGMSFNRGEAFKALWRMGRKPGTPALYDAEKVGYYGARELERLRRDEPVLALDPREGSVKFVRDCNNPNAAPACYEFRDGAWRDTGRSDAPA